MTENEPDDVLDLMDSALSRMSQVVEDLREAVEKLRQCRSERVVRDT